MLALIMQMQKNAVLLFQSNKYDKAQNKPASILLVLALSVMDFFTFIKKFTFYLCNMILFKNIQGALILGRNSRPKEYLCFEGKKSQKLIKIAYLYDG